MNLTKQETATVLAALRYFQLNTFERARTDSFPLHFGECDALTDNEIDDLCERANFDAGDTLADIRSAIKAREGEDVKQPAPRIVIMVSGGNVSLIDEESDPAVTVEVRDYDIEGFDGDFEKDSDGDEYRSFTL